MIPLGPATEQTPVDLFGQAARMQREAEEAWMSFGKVFRLITTQLQATSSFSFVCEIEKLQAEMKRQQELQAAALQANRKSIAATNARS